MDEKQLQALYNAMHSSLDLGDYSTFKNTISSDAKYRKAIYDQASNELDLGDYNTWNKNIGFDSKEVKAQAQQQPKISAQDAMAKYGITNEKPAKESTVVIQPQETAKKAEFKQGLIKALPTLKKKAVENKTLDILAQQGKLPMVGTNDYNALKPEVEGSLMDAEWMPKDLMHKETQDEINAGAIKYFSEANKETPELIEKNIAEGKYIIQDGKVKEVGGFSDNFSQGIRDFVGNVGLALNVSAAQSRNNNNEIKYHLNKYNEDKKNEKETAATDIAGHTGKLLGELAPYAATTAIMPGADIPLMGLSNMGAMNQEIWNDPNLTENEKVAAINKTNGDAFLTGTLQGIAFHSVGGLGEKQTANQLLKAYAPTSALKKKFTQNLYNGFGDLLKTTPKDVAKMAAIGGGTALMNDLTKAREGIKVDFSNVAEWALDLATLDLIMKIPKVLSASYNTLREAKRTGYDKINPEWYNQYSKQSQDALNAIVSAPENIYRDAISQLDKSPDQSSQDAKLKIETFRGYFNSLPAELPKEAKDKALHILQLKTEAIGDAQAATESSIKSYYEKRALAYDGLLNKVLEDGKVDTKDPLLLPRFTAPLPEKEEAEPINLATEEEVKAIHTAAEDAKIDINTDEFKSISKEITGEEHLDNMTPEQLTKINDYINETKAKTEKLRSKENEGTASDNERVTSKESSTSKEVVGETIRAAGEGEIKVGELIDKPITYDGKKATLYQDGQTVVAKIEGENKEYEIGNIDEIRNKSISDFNIEHETSVVGINDNGNISVRSEEYKNNYSDPLAAINHDENGNIVSVNLETVGGKKRTFRGNIAEDIAYQIHLKEITKNNETRNEFEQFINTDEPTSKEINDAGISETTPKKSTENNAKIQRTKAKKSEPKIENKPTEVKHPEIIKLEKERDSKIKEGIKGNTKIELIPAKKLVDAKDPIEAKSKHDKIQEDYKTLKKLIDCL